MIYTAFFAIYYNFQLLQDIGANVIIIIGYFPASIAMAVYTYQWAAPILKDPALDHAYCNLNFVLPIACTAVSW